MPKSALMIASLVIGSSLSIALAGCARPAIEPRTPAAVAVAVERSPPAGLLACPARPEGFPPDQVAMMPPAVRFAAIRLATAYAAATAQLERLIAWETDTPCITKAR